VTLDSVLKNKVGAAYKQLQTQEYKYRHLIITNSTSIRLSNEKGREKGIMIETRSSLQK
jgi:hypothetical protein